MGFEPGLFFHGTRLWPLYIPELRLESLIHPDLYMPAITTALSVSVISFLPSFLLKILTIKLVKSRGDCHLGNPVRTLVRKRRVQAVTLAMHIIRKPLSKFVKKISKSAPCHYEM